MKAVALVKSDNVRSFQLHLFKLSRESSEIFNKKSSRLDNTADYQRLKFPLLKGIEMFVLFMIEILNEQED